MENQNPIKKFKRALQLWDGVWSIPLAGILFLGIGLLLQRMFTDPSDPQGGPGFYDPSFIQVAAYACFIQVCINTAVLAGMFFNFRGLWHYFYGYKGDDGKLINPSKEDFKKLLPWQKICVFLCVYLFLSVEWLLLFVMLR